MGDLAFHFTPAEQACLEAANDNNPEYGRLRKLVALERVVGVRADRQISRDGYRVQDWGKE